MLAALPQKTQLVKENRCSSKVQNQICPILEQYNLKITILFSTIFPHKVIWATHALPFDVK